MTSGTERTRPGVRVRLTRTFSPELVASGSAVDVHIVGTVADYAHGALLLKDVPEHQRGYWAAPSNDGQQATILEVIQ